MKRSIDCKKTLAAAAIALLANAAQATEIYANNPAPGDAYTNNVGDSGQAIGATGWYYNNVRNNTVVGISTANPRSGNGSVSFAAPEGGKADVEFLANAVRLPNGTYAATGSLGLFSQLNSMSYDWYRDGSSAAADHLHPSMRVLLDLDGVAGGNDRGYLVFERDYTGAPTPSDTWVSDTIGKDTFLWNTRFFGPDGFAMGTNINSTSYAYDATLAEWQAFMPNASILGFSSGVGSGWGAFTGAVDNISWTINGVTTLNNFEVEAADVPEPGSAALFGLGLLSAAVMRRRRNKA